MTLYQYRIYNTCTLFYCNLTLVILFQALKLDIEFQDDKMAPLASIGPAVAEEEDSLSSSSETDLRAARRQKVELDYRVRDQASLSQKYHQEIWPSNQPGAD